MGPAEGDVRQRHGSLRHVRPAEYSTHPTLTTTNWQLENGI